MGIEIAPSPGMSDQHEALLRDLIAKEEEIIRSAQQHIDEMKVELREAGRA